MDLSAWLRSLGLSQYEQAFRDNAIAPDVLLQLTTEDLKEIGVAPVGHRRKLLDAIAALRVSSSPAINEQAQRFLSAHDQINNFYLRRDRITAAEHRASRTQRFHVWAEISGIAATM